jgi:CheY-like chemotaxis protein
MLNQQVPIVLIVENDLGDVRMITEALQVADRPREIHSVSNGLDAMNFLRQEGAFAGYRRPDLVLLDLNMPGMDGRETLALIKHDERLHSIPVVVFTSSPDSRDIALCYDRLANAYVPKQTDFKDLMEAVRSIDDFYSSVARLPPHPA